MCSAVLLPAVGMRAKPTSLHGAQCLLVVMSCIAYVHAGEQHVDSMCLLQVTEALLGKQPEELGVDGYTLQRLRADVQMQLTAFKNAAYTSGYTAGKQEVVAYATKQYV